MKGRPCVRRVVVICCCRTPRAFIVSAVVLLATTVAGHARHEAARPEDAAALFAQATALLETGDPHTLERSMQLFEQARVRFVAQGAMQRAAHAEIGIGTALWRRQDYDRGAHHLAHATWKLESLGDLRGAAAAATNRGILEVERGHTAEALATLEDALDLARAAGDRPSSARAEVNLAALYAELGESQAALDLFRQALAGWRLIDDPTALAAVHMDIGLLFLQLRDLDTAREHLSAARIIDRGQDNHAGAADSAIGLGLIARAEGEFDKAWQLMSDAASTHQRIGNTPGEAAARANLATIAIDRSHRDPSALTHAKREAEAAISLARAVQDRRSEARALAASAAAQLASGRLRSARERAEDAARIHHAIEDPLGGIDVSELLARIETAAGHLDDAARHAETAARAVEQRTLPSADSLYASTLGGHRRIFDTLVTVELARWREQSENTSSTQGNGPVRALVAADRGRRHAIHRSGFGHDGADALPATIDAERRLRDEVRHRNEARRHARIEGRTGAVAQLEREMRALTIAREELIAAPGTIPHDLERTRDDLIALRDHLGRETSLLVFHLGRETATLFVLDHAGLNAAHLGPSSIIANKADRLRQLLAEPPSRIAEAPIETLARELGALLLGAPFGVHRDDEPGVHEARDGEHRVEVATTASSTGLRKRLLIVPDDALEGLPMAALIPPRAERALGFDHEITTLPSATAALTLTRHRAQTQGPARLALIVGSDSLDTLRRPALPGAEWAVDFLSTQAGEASQVFRHLNAESIRGGALDGFRFVHFATHTEIDLRAPAASALVLGDDAQSLLQVIDLDRLRIEADLVSLAGCRTADGRPVPGAGVLGFSRALLATGVPRVLLSHWPVDDRSTAHMMVAFYRAVLDDGQPPAAALVSARREIARDPRWRAPHHWAAFELIGDWR